MCYFLDKFAPQNVPNFINFRQNFHKNKCSWNLWSYVICRPKYLANYTFSQGIVSAIENVPNVVCTKIKKQNKTISIEILYFLSTYFWTCKIVPSIWPSNPTSTPKSDQNLTILGVNLSLHLGAGANCTFCTWHHISPTNITARWNTWKYTISHAKMGPKMCQKSSIFDEFSTISKNGVKIWLRNCTPKNTVLKSKGHFRGCKMSHFLVSS